MGKSDRTARRDAHREGVLEILGGKWWQKDLEIIFEKRKNGT